MGNHDNRSTLYDALAAQRPQNPPVESKHVSVLETPHANWLLLDSLFQVNVVTGELGEAQLAWLGRALDAHPDKPALVMAHHTPQFDPPEENTRWTGMRDTAPLFELLESRPQVKAFVYGHSHTWKISRRGRLHLINLPPVAYVFGEEMPSGWVAAQCEAGGLRLTLHTLDSAHPQANQQVELAWD
jgi:3',5'-cyclic AMP phosphodiesterase CpdA